MVERQQFIAASLERLHVPRILAVGDVHVAELDLDQVQQHLDGAFRQAHWPPPLSARLLAPWPSLGDFNKKSVNRPEIDNDVPAVREGAERRRRDGSLTGERGAGRTALGIRRVDTTHGGGVAEWLKAAVC